MFTEHGQRKGPQECNKNNESNKSRKRSQQTQKQHLFKTEKERGPQRYTKINENNICIKK